MLTEAFEASNLLNLHDFIKYESNNDNQQRKFAAIEV